MIYIEPTKRGIGVKIWGTYGDLNILYEVIGKFWDNEHSFDKEGFDSRDKVISIFSYDIRKAQEGLRLKKKAGNSFFEEGPYFGTQISWVEFLFSLTALKYNMRFKETSKLDISVILQLEYWLEKAMYAYDEIGAKELVGFIDGGIYGANKYLYFYMRSIHLDFLLLDGGKRSFRRLPSLLKRGAFYTDAYEEYEVFLKKEAERLNCDIHNMEIDDNDIDYDVKW